MFHSVVRKSRDAGIARETFYGEPNSFDILQRHSPTIDVVPHRACGTFSSYEDLCAELADLHKQVTNSTLSASEEGAVITFIRRNGEGGATSDHVISMCKIKSVEYSSLSLLLELLRSSIE